VSLLAAEALFLEPPQRCPTPLKRSFAEKPPEQTKVDLVSLTSSED
jgi:hypothetical protein